MSDCEVFDDLCSYIANWRCRQARVKETSLTDWFLYELSEKIPWIKYLDFSPADEKRITGADWEWWFLYPNETNVRLRVQAKRALRSGNYDSLVYEKGTASQIRTLLADAKHQNAIPLYVFYSGLNISDTRCARKMPASGVFLQGAKSIYDDFVKRGKHAIADLDVLKRSIPFSCLICCPLAQYPESRGMFFKHYFERERRFLSHEHDYPGLHRKLPDYVLSLTRQPKGESAVTGDENVPSGVRLVVVFDFRDFRPIQ
jgi:hypothetical protein